MKPTQIQNMNDDGDVRDDDDIDDNDDLQCSDDDDDGGSDIIMMMGIIRMRGQRKVKQMTTMMVRVLL